ncbi:MAG: O-acetylhomoserine aminocarboxypropyltransferase/cysteine synthase, partial [Nitrospinae bacterium]|nr:O-acetylhomoserine aminocarboxypropyltransferase/cysteine synthase [Nitrospinota bacterium]
MSKQYKRETVALHGGLTVDETTSRGVPIHRTSSYVFRDTEHAANLFGLKELGNIYTRLMNPTHDVLEKRVAELEGGGAALALASGTSAIFYTIINICRTGDEVVSSKYLYGGTYTMFNDILPNMGIKVRFVDPSSIEAIEKAVNEKTRLIFAETIGNPTLDVTNMSILKEVA